MGVRRGPVRVHEHQPDVQCCDRCSRRLRMLGIAKQDGGSTVLQQLGQLVGMERRIERHDGASRGDNSKIGRHPSRMIIRNHGQSRAGRKSVFADPSSNGFRHAAKFGVSTAFDLIVALEFQRDVVRPSLLALKKAVVESGHDRGEYTRKIYLPLCVL